MALTGPQKIPFAVTSGTSWYGDNYTGTPFEANVGVVHTTEGTALPSYGGGASAPNVTGVPNLDTQTIKWYQHYDVDRSSRALRNASGGVETNQLNAFQVELVGTCDPATRDKWKAEGRKFIFWPDAPDWALREFARLVRWLSDNHQIQIKSTVTWRAYPSSYGQFAGQRLTGVQWENYYGWLGHQHVPENDHGDPGNIDFDRVIQFALGGTTGGEEVVLTDEDVKKVVDGLLARKAELVAAIFRTDGVLDSPDGEADPDGNTHWWAQSYLKDTYLALRGVKLDVASVSSKVDGLATGGIDLDALAVKVADEIYKRMAG